MFMQNNDGEHITGLMMPTSKYEACESIQYQTTV